MFNNPYTVDMQFNEKTKMLTANILDAETLTLIEPLAGTFKTEVEVYKAASEWSKTLWESLSGSDEAS